MTAEMPREQARAVDAVRRAAARIDKAEFAAYGGGWPDEVGTALVDAAFSMRARYHSENPGAGVFHRVQKFQSTFPRATDDLEALAALDVNELRSIMGSGKSAGRHKAECVLDAAKAFLRLDPPVRTAAEVRERDPQLISNTYASVRGLGGITAEYFLMLLGVPGVKADVMIVRFVNAALAAENLSRVGAKDARELVVQSHGQDDHGVGLIAYEHAIWRTRGSLAAAR